MAETKKKVDKVTLITIAVVAILILTFVVGFIWGLNNVLAMEGTMPPSEIVESEYKAPETKQEAVDFLNTAIEKAVSEKPRFESRTEYGIDEESLETDGSSQLKDTLLYVRESFTDYLNENAEKQEADYFRGFENLLRKPVISADDVEDFKCDYIYYQCASCNEESEEPLDKCDACGSENPYNMKYRDEYSFTLTLKNSEQIAKDNFAPKTGDEAVALLGEDAAQVTDISDVETDNELLTVVFTVDRLKNEIKTLQYIKDMNISAKAAFKGDYADIGSCEASFKMTKSDIFDFTWPSLVLSDKKMTVAPKKSDNLLATITCDDPTGYEVKWESSDESVLTIDDEGYFKGGDKAGEAVVTASFEFGGKTYSDTCRVYVRNSVESIKVSDREIELEKGETHKLSVAVSPKKATVQTVKWFTEDESIATVDVDGVVTAVSSGTVKVYAISDDEFYKSTCEVRVK